MDWKTLKTSIRAKKPLLIFGLTGVLAIGIIFLTFASSIFVDTFDTYNNGNLSGQGGWSTCATYTSAVVQDTIVGSGSKAAQFNGTNKKSGCKIGTSQASGLVSFWVRRDNTTNTTIRMRQGVSGDYWQLSITNIAGFSNSGTGTCLGNLSMSTDGWYIVVVEWTPNQDRINWNGTGWSNWCATNFISLDRWEQFNSSTYNLYLDQIGEGVCMLGSCDFCTTPQMCQAADCCWYYSHLPDFNVCSDCPSECAGGYYDCAYCLTQEDCEDYTPTCYWENDQCYYSSAVCGEGLMVIYCTTEVTCTGNGGYWYDEFCWTTPKSTLTSWENYYDTNGENEEPTEFVNGLATAVGDFISKVGGFLTTFNTSFDKRAAYQRGQDFGSYVPIAMGYLGILDTFAGNLPFEDFFLFILIFMLAVGVFRIVRSIIQLIKLL